MRPEVSNCLWSLPRLGEAMELLARQSGLSPRAVELTPPPLTIGDSATWERWIESAAGILGLVAEPRDTSYGNVNRLLGDISPALLQIPNDGEPGFLALIRTRGNDLMVLAPDRSMRRLSGEAVRAALCAPIEAPRIEQLDRVLELELERQAGRLSGQIGEVKHIRRHIRAGLRHQAPPHRAVAILHP